MRYQSTLRTAAITAPLFAVAGAISRFNLRSTETRWQIVALGGFALGLEALIRLGGPGRASLGRAGINAAAAATAIISVKFHLEPYARKHDGALMRDTAKSVAHKVAGSSEGAVVAHPPNARLDARGGAGLR